MVESERRAKINNIGEMKRGLIKPLNERDIDVKQERRSRNATAAAARSHFGRSSGLVHLLYLFSPPRPAPDSLRPNSLQALALNLDR